MSNCEPQITATGKFWDEKIKPEEKKDIEILSPLVPGSRPHEAIHNPIDSGIDED